MKEVAITRMIWCGLIGGCVAQVASVSAQGTRADYDRAANLRKRTQGTVFKQRVAPHWFAQGRKFWYRNDLPDDTHEFMLVDAWRASRTVAFDHQKLSQALAEATSTKVDARNLPFQDIAFDDQGRIRFRCLKHDWVYDSPANQLDRAEDVVNRKPAASPSPSDDTQLDDGGSKDKPPQKTASPKTSSKKAPEWHPGQSRTESPDGKWKASIRDHNLHLTDRKTGTTTALTSDGTEADAYRAGFHWSADARRLVVFRLARGEEHKVHLIEAAPQKQLQPRLHTLNYRKPGDRIPISKPYLFDVESGQPIAVDDALFSNPWSIKGMHWQPDSARFRFVYNQRGHQVLRVCDVDADSGAVRALIDERSATFVDYAYKQFVRHLDASREIIWMSERDGWNHLYLYDSDTGQVKNQITQGDWVVLGVDRVDEQERRIWFRAGGVYPGQDPYHVHHCSVRFDGSDFVRLTQGDGTHRITFSPDRRFFVDSWSRVDQPPVTELRRSEDGVLVCELERGDWSRLLRTGWRVPQRFVAKGRDGKTDIYGVIFRPTGFDPDVSYPVIEKIYAGPHGAFVPKAFAAYHKAQSMAELGFVVVQIDGMGTSRRSKAFHDVCWKNLGDSGFSDRKLWIRAAQRVCPNMDLTRVGIYGGSAGGQSALRALLAHGDFYKVAVSDCGCHDNRMDKIWWNELWMGWPIGDHYAEQSNVTQAHKLKGKLLLIVGAMDRNVDPASTMQVVDALIKADRDFDLLVVPGGGHGIAESRYGNRRRQDYFVRHLLDVEPRRQAIVSAETQRPVDGPKGGSHQRYMLAGWRVYVDRKLVDGPAAGLGRVARRVLAGKLQDIALVVPAGAVKQLQKTPIWLDFEHRLESLQYHPSARWLRDNGYDAALAGGVHIPRAERFVELQKSNQQPWVMLHELAHAYHDRVLGFDHEPVRDAYQRAMHDKLYDAVLHHSGARKRHYATMNHKEFFAEMTESYFGTNDFFPFIRAELKAHDPKTYQLFKRVWEPEK